MKKIVVYDFDKTIYGGETSTDFMRFFLKRNKKYIKRLPYVIKSLFYYNKNLKRSKEIFFKILDNIDMELLKNEIREFWKQNNKKIFSWISDEIKVNKLESDELILISATPSIFLEEISKELGFDKLIATEFVKQKDNFISKIEGSNCKGVEKVYRLQEYLENFEIIKFYSDSMSDKPLFDLAKEKYFIKKGIKEVLEY
ncbi:HAD-IB family hydrolase [Pseudostreptobacillus hongkongensis]|uniref:HAD-IB family hydrolase n=1 Tax=Pseudostreptobacillus hongkongensis TaxID=1162717 RepID=UPI00082F75A9|nr:HAD-IB family hydrolase [Pseudostreptobacillus hongkongensis]